MIVVNELLLYKKGVYQKSNICNYIWDYHGTSIKGRKCKSIIIRVFCNSRPLQNKSRILQFRFLWPPLQCSQFWKNLINFSHLWNRVHLKLWSKLESQENEWYWGHGFRLFNYFHIHPQKHKLALLQMESSIISKIVSTKTLKVHRAENEEFKEKPEIIGLIGLKELVAKNPLIPSLQCWMNIYHRKYQIRPSHWSQKTSNFRSPF